MKNFLLVATLVVLFAGLLIAISAYLGRDLLVSIQNSVTAKNESNGSKVISKFAIISDTHSDTERTDRAVKQIRALGLKYIVHTGDWTTVGTREELLTQKEIFDNIALPYWGVMGDHDRWQSQERNFESIFGKRYEAIEKNNILHILMDSSDLNNGFGEEQLSWLELLLKKNPESRKLIFMHLPPYHPSSDRTVSSKGGTSAIRDQEVDRFLNLIKDQNVLAIFSGDHHLSASYTEPKTSVRIFISGAATADRNLQTPRWSLVEVHENGFISFSDQVIN